MSEPRHFSPSLRGRELCDEPMKKHVSWRAGGRAAIVYVPADLADLQQYLATRIADEPIAFVGLGSNLLVRDGGFPGVVVLMHDTHGAMRIDNDSVYADAGVANPKVARFAANQGFEAAFLAGVPGTVGGALAMNAGCYGSETWQFVGQVQTIDRSGTLRLREPADFELGYRHCVLRASAAEEWFTAAWFRFNHGDRNSARERIKTLLGERVATQPLNLPNAGSVFRNPPGDYAARLIESCGLKGYTIGGAQISSKHANFIVNPGGLGSAADIEALIEHARRTVLDRFGIALVPEVRIIGTAAPQTGAPR